VARTVDEELRARRREAILAGTAELVAGKGYERMSVRDVIEHVGISKGAFYHYFRSKPELLEALVDRMSDQMVGPLTEVVEAPMAVEEKLSSFFLTMTRRKAQERALLSGILAAWYDDSNAVVRHKLRAASRERFAPLLGEILGRSGFSRPDLVGEVVWDLTQDLVDALSRVLLADGSPAELRARIDVTTEAVERVLGMEGGLRLIDDEVVEGWAR
jgi:AcrR family transcriptional regulator